MTAFYSWRLIFMTFFGPEKGDKHTHDHAHESPMVMLVPLGVLAIGAVLSGVLGYHYFFGEGVGEWFGAAVYNNHETNHVIHEAHGVPTWVKLSPFVAMVGGTALAWLMYIVKPSIPAALAKRNGALYRFLLNKWYFDEVYDFLFVKPAFKLGNFLWKKGDGKVIDGGLNGLALGIIPWFTKLAGRWQSGYVFTYALAMILGVGGLITWFMITRGLN